MISKRLVTYNNVHLVNNSVTREGLGVVVGMCVGMFYADDGMIGLRDPECLQGATNTLIVMLRRVRLMDNIEK